MPVSATPIATVNHGKASRRITTIRPAAYSASGILSDALRLVRYRELLYTLTLHRIRVRYKQSVLGASWAIVQPTSLMLIYTLIFSLIMRIPTEGTPYAIFAYSALLPWTFFATALSNATSALVSHTQLITKVYFPREILPLSYILASLVDLAVASSVFAVLMVYYDVPVTPTTFYAVPIVLILVCFTTAVALIFSATQVRFRDVGVALPLILQLWMFATPVVYPLSAVPERFQRLYAINPMVGLIDSFREATVHGASPDVMLVGLSAVVSFILLIVAWIYFKRVESTVADVI